MGRVDVSESAGGSNLSWSVLGSNLPWSTSLTTRAAYEGSVETDTSAYWSTLTFCYSIMPTDNGALDGLGADGCSVGPGSGDTFTATAVSASQDAPTWTLWIWTCTGTSGASMSGCLAYGKARDWILAGS
jgi:hypothetical protein